MAQEIRFEDFQQWLYGRGVLLEEGGVLINRHKFGLVMGSMNGVLAQQHRLQQQVPKIANQEFPRIQSKQFFGDVGILNHLKPVVSSGFNLTKQAEKKWLAKLLEVAEQDLEATLADGSAAEAEEEESYKDFHRRWRKAARRVFLVLENWFQKVGE